MHSWIRVYIWDAASFYNKQVSNCYYYNISGLGLPLLCQQVHVVSYNIIQWNPSKTDTIGTDDCVRYSKGVLSSGVSG